MADPWSVWRLLVLLVASCGRIGFDVGATGNDAPGGGSDAAASIAGNCASPIDIMINGNDVNESITPAETIDAFASCNGPAVVTRLQLAAGAMATLEVEATFDGALVVDSNCPPMAGPCQAFQSTYSNPYSFSAGTTYIVVWRTATTNTHFQLSLE